MVLGFCKKIENAINKNNNSFIEELSKGLEIMEQELVVDRFEENIVICEDRKTGKIVELDKTELPKDIKEGSILKYENGKYQIDVEKQEEISDKIERKMNDLWNK